MSEPLTDPVMAHRLIESQGDIALRDFRGPSLVLAEDDAFGHLALRLAARLQVRCVVIGFLEGTDTVRVYALVLDGERKELGSYALKGTPCENVLDRNVCYYHDDVHERFPEDEMLVQMGSRSYFGMPIQSGDGQALGLIAALDSEPIQLQWDSLQLLASMAGAALATHSGAST